MSLSCGFFLGRVVGARAAGEREEDLVQARLAEGELADGDAGAGELGERVGDTAGVGDAGREGGGVGFEANLRIEDLCQQSLGVVAALRVANADVEGTASCRCLELTA